MELRRGDRPDPLGIHAGTLAVAGAWVPAIALAAGPAGRVAEVDEAAPEPALVEQLERPESGLLCPG